MHHIPVSKAHRMHSTNQVRYLTQLIMNQAFHQTLHISKPLGGCIWTQTIKAIRSSLPQGITGATPICAHVSFSSCLTNIRVLSYWRQYHSARGNALCTPVRSNTQQQTTTHSSRKQCLTLWSLELHKVCHVLLLISA